VASAWSFAAWLMVVIPAAAGARRAPAFALHGSASVGDSYSSGEAGRLVRQHQQGPGLTLTPSARRPHKKTKTKPTTTPPTLLVISLSSTSLIPLFLHLHVFNFFTSPSLSITSTSPTPTLLHPSLLLAYSQLSQFSSLFSSFAFGLRPQRG